MNARLRNLVRQRAGGRCEYCRIHEDDEPFTFHVEHVIARKHGGRESLTNLAWSCHNCNCSKGSNLTGFLSGAIIPLFNPRRQRWRNHFRWSGPRLVGRTACGRATIDVLNINRIDRVRLRRLLIQLGAQFPTG